MCWYDCLEIFLISKHRRRRKSRRQTWSPHRFPDATPSHGHTTSGHRLPSFAMNDPAFGPVSPNSNHLIDNNTPAFGSSNHNHLATNAQRSHRNTTTNRTSRTPALLPPVSPSGRLTSQPWHPHIGEFDNAVKQRNTRATSTVMIPYDPSVPSAQPHSVSSISSPPATIAAPVNAQGHGGSSTRRHAHVGGQTHGGLHIRGHDDGTVYSIGWNTSGARRRRR